MKPWWGNSVQNTLKVTPNPFSLVAQHVGMSSPRWCVLSSKGLVVRLAESVASEQLGRLSCGAEVEDGRLGSAPALQPFRVAETEIFWRRLEKMDYITHTGTVDKKRKKDSR